MWVVFLILWIVILVAGLGASAYGIYQFLEEPLQGWRAKKKVKTPAKSESKPVAAETKQNVVADADAENEEEDFEEMNLTMNEDQGHDDEDDFVTAGDDIEIYDEEDEK